MYIVVSQLAPFTVVTYAEHITGSEAGYVPSHC